MVTSQFRELARQNALAWAQNLMEHRDQLIAFDTETTGVNGMAEVVEIGVVDGHGEVLLSSLVRPIDPIPDGAYRVHGISNLDVADAPTWPEIYVQLKQLFDSYPYVTIYNMDFDLRLINQSSARYSLPKFNYHINPSRYEWSCAMKQYSAYSGVWNASKGGFRWAKLGDAIQSFGITVPDDSHRAHADAISTIKLIEAMSREGVSV